MLINAKIFESYLMAKKNVCQSCISHSGGCCVDVRFSVHMKEAKPFIDLKNYDKLPDGHKFYMEKGEKDTYIYSSGGNRCVFLTDKNTCGIYDQRPLICRMYPILWKPNDNYYVDLACPLTHLVPLKDISEWPSKPINKEILNQINELDFDGRNRQYINLKTIREMNDALEILDDPDVSM